MLTQLTIKNFGLIDNINVEFVQTLNILTGSTGTGKSIIIEGLRFALGERIKPSQIRDPKKSCTVEAVFFLPNERLQHHQVFRDFISQEDPTLIIHRQLFPDGRSKIKINGLTVTIAQLKVLGNHLVDLHGPHDHQMLFSEESHRVLLDRLIVVHDQLKEYQEHFKHYAHLKDQLKDLEHLSLSKNRDLDLLSHQIKELSSISLEDNAYEQICQDHSKINNVERLHQCVSAILAIFEHPDIGITDAVHNAFGLMKTLVQIDHATSTIEEHLSTIQDNSHQLIIALKDYLDSLAFEPHEAHRINEQYDLYEIIKRKYGPSLSDAHTFYLKTKERYDLLADLEHNDAQLKEEIQQKEKHLRSLAHKITTQRHKASSELKTTIEKELKSLGIDHVTFEARLITTDLNAYGQDQVVFYISPNAGEDLKPLAEIASSGEAARMMLALKKALTKVDPIPVLIFDEIDAQIGGRLGEIVGAKLKELSVDRQVILITHLPQIASFADAHFKVSKQIMNGRTLTTVRLLDSTARVEELSEMMSGNKKSEVSISHAKDMITKANKKICS